MKKLRLIPIYVLLIAAFSACEKDKLPEPTVENPVFQFAASINGSPVSLTAGVNDYYLYTSVSQDGNGVKSYIANLKTVDCSACPNSIKITFIDYKSSTPTATQIDSTFYLGRYNFATVTGLPSRYDVSFTSNTLGPIPTGINYQFGDGNSKLELNPTHTYVRPGKYNTCIDATFLGGGTSSLCNSFVLGNHGEYCEAMLNPGTPTGKTFNFTSNANLGEAPYTYQWDFGDGNGSAQQNPTHTYAVDGVYTVSVTATDANGLSDTESQNVRTDGSTDPVARFSYVINGVSNPSNLGNVIIEWTDANGTTYTSKNDAQPNYGYFRIVSIEDYKPNENGLATKKLHVKFTCTLYNGASSILMKDADAVIAVAY